MWRLPRALLPIYGTTLVDTLGYTLMIPLLPAIVKEYHASDVMVGGCRASEKERASGCWNPPL